MEEGSSETAGLQGGCRSTQAEFHWKRSDNSFAFNFLPEASSSQNYITSTPVEGQAKPSQGAKSHTDSGFTFNFQIPTEKAQSAGLKTSVMQVEKTEVGIKTTELSADSSKSKVKKKKKKKKGVGGEGGEEHGLQKTMNKVIEEAPKQKSTELSPEEQFNRELDWCIEQLELGLRTQKSSAKQREEASHALKTLRSSKAPVVKKRQVMRAVSGDYRKKMEEEKNRQFKLMQSAMTSTRVTSVSEPSRKPVFHRHAQTKGFRTDKPQDTHVHPHAAEQTDGDVEKFVFKPTHEKFCFNFNL